MQAKDATGVMLLRLSNAFKYYNVSHVLLHTLINKTAKKYAGISKKNPQL